MSIGFLHRVDTPRHPPATSDPPHSPIVASSSLPTLYKARKVPTKQAVCAICAERTRGRTRLVELGYGVTVHLCQGHASQEFQTQRNGRDFVLTLQRLWHAHGCLTAARSNALRRHLTACSGTEARPRPGSYSWPELRQTAAACTRPAQPTHRAPAPCAAGMRTGVGWPRLPKAS